MSYVLARDKKAIHVNEEALREFLPEDIIERLKDPRRLNHFESAQLNSHLKKRIRKMFWEGRQQRVADCPEGVPVPHFYHSLSRVVKELREAGHHVDCWREPLPHHPLSGSRAVWQLVRSLEDSLGPAQASGGNCAGA
jgi:hypothetical protein